MNTITMPLDGAARQLREFLSRKLAQYAMRVSDPAETQTVKDDARVKMAVIGVLVVSGKVDRKEIEEGFLLSDDADRLLRALDQAWSVLEDYVLNQGRNVRQAAGSNVKY